MKIHRIKVDLSKNGIVENLVTYIEVKDGIAWTKFDGKEVDICFLHSREEIDEQIRCLRNKHINGITYEISDVLMLENKGKYRLFSLWKKQQTDYCKYTEQDIL